jgi:uncharacterized membrane protein
MMLRYVRGTESKVLYDVLLFISTLSVALSAYLGYILYFVLENTCLVCYLTHICNIGIFMSLFLTYYSSGTAQDVERKPSAIAAKVQASKQASQQIKSNKKKK